MFAHACYALHNFLLQCEKIGQKKRATGKTGALIGVKVKTSRGEQLMRWNWEEKPPCASAMCDMVF